MRRDSKTSGMAKPLTMRHRRWRPNPKLSALASRPALQILPTVPRTKRAAHPRGPSSRTEQISVKGLVIPYTHERAQLPARGGSSTPQESWAASNAGWTPEREDRQVLTGDHERLAFSQRAPGRTQSPRFSRERHRSCGGASRFSGSGSWGVDAGSTGILGWNTPAASRMIGGTTQPDSYSTPHRCVPNVDGQQGGRKFPGHEFKVTSDRPTNVGNLADPSIRCGRLETTVDLTK